MQIINLLLLVMLGGFAVVSLLAVCGAAFWILEAVGQQQPRSSTALSDFVQSRGGDCPDGHLVGVFRQDDRSVSLAFYSEPSVSSLRRTDLEVVLPIGTPGLTLKMASSFSGLGTALGMQDIPLGDQRFDDAFRVQGLQSSVQALLTDEIRALILHLNPDHSLEVEILSTPEGARLQVHRLGWMEERAALTHYVDGCIRLAALLEARHAASWLAAADATGLTLSQEGPPTLSGVLDGVTVQAGLVWRSSQWDTVIQVPIQGPAGLRIVHIDQGRGESLSVENPILGMMAHITADDPDAARALLADTALTEELLAVVHGIPGSTVTEDAVTITLPGRLWEELPETVALAARLAARISARSRELTGRQSVRLAQRALTTGD